MEPVHDAMYRPKKGGGYTKVYKEGFVEKHVTELGLAIILMADGTLNRRDNVISLALNNLTEPEIHAFNAAVNTKFGLHGKVLPDRTKSTVKPQFFVRYPVVDRA
jgi:hypothetical protein